MTDERSAPLRVVVTGAGGRIAGRLRDAGGADAVDGTSASTLPGPIEWRWASSRPVRSDEIGLDPGSRDSWAGLLERERPDVVVHLAGPVPGGTPSGAGLRASSAGAVSQLLPAAASAGVRRIVLASSAAVYGDRGAAPRRETDAAAPVGEYGRDKAEAEELVAAAVGAGHIREAIILRPFNVFGAPMADSLVSRLMRSEPADPVVLRGWDEFIRDYIHVDDVADAFRAAAVHQLDGPVLIANVARGVGVSNRALVDELLIAREAPLHYIVADGQPSFSVADTSVMTSTLGVTARRGLRFGLA